MVGSQMTRNRNQLNALSQRLGYTFKDPRLLELAVVHSSFAFEQAGSCRDNNERLEFLGDAVLDLAVGALLYERFPERREGELTRIRSALVNEAQLARVARALELGDFLLLGKGEEATGGREKPSILACAFEAVCGAIFLDGGFDAAREFISRHFTSWIEKCHDQGFIIDPKSRLQEFLQERYNEAPVYTLTGEEGPDHDKRFTVLVSFQGKPLASGTARSKKEAEQQAAASALKELSQGA